MIAYILASFAIILYMTALILAIYHIIKYLVPMKITKPLIVFFYMLIVIKLSVVILMIVYALINFNMRPEPYSKLWFVYMTNYISDALLWAIFMMQWLHVAFAV